MAIKFQYNKTALNNLNKQLKMRKNALPTLQNKESALRLEVRKAKDESERLTVGYCRVSSRKQLDDLERQVENVKTYLLA